MRRPNEFFNKLLDLRTGKRSLLSTTVSSKFASHMRPDGTDVIYGERDAHGGTIYAVPVSGGAPEKLCDGCESFLYDWSPDRKRILYSRQGKTSALAIGMLNLETGKHSVFLEAPDKALYSAHWSPDGRWIAFFASRVGFLAQIYVAPFTGDQGPSESAWIPIADGPTRGSNPNWSPDGNWIYAFSNRDGFRCILAYRLDPENKKPLGRPVEVFHSHGTQLAIRYADVGSQELSVARDKIVFNQGERTGNIWMTELPDKK